MSKAIIDEQSLTDIADAIRAKNGSADTYKPAEMATAITDLPSGGAPAEQEVYEIVADTACSDMLQCQNWVTSKLAEYTGTYYFAYIFYIGTSPVNNQFISAIHYSANSFSSINSIVSTSARYKNGTIQETVYTSPAYDGVINVGDHYRLVLIKAELVAS